MRIVQFRYYILSLPRVLERSCFKYQSVYQNACMIDDSSSVVNVDSIHFHHLAKKRVVDRKFKTMVSSLSICKSNSSACFTACREGGDGLIQWHIIVLRDANRQI